MYKNTLIYGISKIITASISFFLIVFLTRSVSPEIYGKYNTLMITVSGIYLIAFQWINMAIARLFVDTSERNRDQFYGEINTLLTFMMFVTVLVIFTLGNFLNYSSTNYLLILLVLKVIFEYLLRLFNSTHRVYLYNALLTLNSLFLLFFMCIFVSLEKSTNSLYLANVLCLTIVVCLGAFFFKNRFSFCYPKLWAKQVCVYGSPFIFILSLGFLVDSSDRYIIGLLMSNSDVGIYAATYDLVQYSVGFLMGAINTAVYPQIMGVLDNKEELDKRLTQLLELIMITTVPILLGLIVLSKIISNVVLGWDFATQASTIFPYVGIGIFFAGIKVFYLDYSFQISKSIKPLVYISGFMATLNILLNYLFIQVLGIKGAAVATLLTYASGVLLSAYFGRREFKLPKMSQDIGKIILSAVIMAFAVSVSVSPSYGVLELIRSILIGIIVYFFMLYLFDVSAVKVFLNKIKFNMRLNVF